MQENSDSIYLKQEKQFSQPNTKKQEFRLIQKNWNLYQFNIRKPAIQ